jgi:ribosomal protein L24
VEVRSEIGFLKSHFHPSFRIHPNDNQELLTKTMEDGAELMQTKRPWEVDKVQQTLSREREYKRALFSTKFLQKAHREVPVIPAEEWTFFQGDLVVVMVGRDKGKAGFISHVIREENAVFVEGLNTKPIQKMSKEMVKTMGYKSFDQWEEQPLFVHRGQVRLVDPNDEFVVLAYLSRIFFHATF